MSTNEFDPETDLGNTIDYCIFFNLKKNRISNFQDLLILDQKMDYFLVSILLQYVVKKLTGRVEFFIHYIKNKRRVEFLSEVNKQGPHLY